MNDKRARFHVDALLGSVHDAAALEAEVDLGRVGVTVIRTDLARLPARHRKVAAGFSTEDVFDVPARIELLLVTKIENVQRMTSFGRLGPAVLGRAQGSAGPGHGRTLNAQGGPSVSFADLRPCQASSVVSIAWTVPIGSARPMSNG